MDHKNLELLHDSEEAQPRQARCPINFPGLILPCTTDQDVLMGKVDACPEEQTMVQGGEITAMSPTPPRVLLQCTQSVPSLDCHRRRGT